MEIQKQKCSSKEAQDINVISYCGQCNIYMCNKCEKFHIKLFFNHKIYNLEKQTGEIFTGFCKEKNHLNKLQIFFVKPIILYVVLCAYAKLEKMELDYIKIARFALQKTLKKKKK